MGRVVKDFGVLEEKSFLVGKMKKSLRSPSPPPTPKTEEIVPRR
jgi:hypothetical protein